MGVEVASLIAALLGLTAKDLVSEVKSRRRAWSEKRAREHVEATRRVATPQCLANAVTAYYADAAENTPLRRYAFRVNDHDVPTSLYCRPEWLGEPSNLRDIRVVLGSPHPTQPPLSQAEQMRAFAAELLARMEVLGTRVWDAPTYALSSINSNPLALAFFETSFLGCRFGAALAGDELSDALVAKAGNPDELLRARRSLLPLRDALLPSLAALENYSSRGAAGGVGVVLAMAHSGGFRIPIQVRSGAVADGSGFRAVVPKAYHQPAIGDPEELHPYWTVLRELFEECFGGHEAERDALGLLYNWYLRECEPVAYIHDRPSVAHVWIHGVALNAVNGNYELAITVAIQDEWFWSNYLAKRNWEIARWVPLDTRDAHAVSETLLDPHLVNESRFHLAEALMALRARFPARVADVHVHRSLS